MNGYDYGTIAVLLLFVFFPLLILKVYKMGFKSGYIRFRDNERDAWNDGYHHGVNQKLRQVSMAMVSGGMPHISRTIIPPKDPYGDN